MQVTHTVVVTATPDELKAGAIEQARAAAKAAAPSLAGLDAASCQTDLQATGTSTFTFTIAGVAPASGAA